MHTNTVVGQSYCQMQSHLVRCRKTGSFVGCHYFVRCRKTAELIVGCNHYFVRCRKTAELIVGCNHYFVRCRKTAELIVGCNHYFVRHRKTAELIVGCNHYFVGCRKTGELLSDAITILSDVEKVVILYDNLCRKVMFLRYTLYCIMISACLK